MIIRDKADGVEAVPTATSTVFRRATKRRPCLIYGKPDWVNIRQRWQALLGWFRPHASSFGHNSTAVKKAACSTLSK
jgi:hypothetical protein